MNYDNIWCVRPREQGVEYFVEHHDCFLYILTNTTKTGNFCLKKASVVGNQTSQWNIVLEESPEYAIEDMMMFEKRFGTS